MAHAWGNTRPIYYGTAAERAAFPAAGEAAGALFFDYDDEKLYKWDGAAWVEVGAGGGWKLGNIIVVSSSGDGDHLTIAAAFAAAAPFDTILVDSGTYTCNDETLPQGCRLIGLTRDTPILQNTVGGNVLQFSGGAAAFVGDIQLYSAIANAGATNSCITLPNTGDTIRLERCHLYAANNAAGGTAALVVTASDYLELHYCSGDATNSNQPSSVFETSGGTVVAAYVYGGQFAADYVYSMGGGTYYYYNLPAFTAAFLPPATAMPTTHGSCLVIGEGIYTFSDLFLDMDQTAGAPANPLASRWRAWFEADGLHILNNAGTEYIFPGGIDPAGHTHSKLVASDGAPDPAQSNDASGNLTGVGWLASDAHAFKVKNTSGGAAAANDVGYIDENGEYKTTTTAYADVAWCVVVSGGANNADIYVARRGRVTVALNGNCSAGDYLYTSTTDGQAQPQTYTRPELFAVALTANAGGAGGTCSALLLCHTRYVNVQSAIDVFSVNPTSSTDFRATINGAPVGATLVYNAPTSGAEDTIDPTANNLYGKIRLYNETRAEYLLIDDVNVGTNTITFTTNVPGTWVNGDTITARSQTVTPGGTYYYDVDLSSADNTAVPELARAIDLTVIVRDTAVGVDTRFHPWVAYAAAKIQLATVYLANQDSVQVVAMPLFQRRYCFQVNANGSGSAYHFQRLRGYWIAEP